MYYHSRAEAGGKLAESLVKYRDDNAIIVAMNAGGVLVGEPISTSLHCPLTMLLSEQIDLPGEQIDIGTISQDGSFVYNNAFSSGEAEEYYSEFHGYIEDQKREQLAKMHRLLGRGGLVNKKNLKDHNIILVSDGLKTGVTLEAAHAFLKPVDMKSLIIAVPIASVQAVDRMHILADELHCLSVTDNYIETNHYYDDNNVPTQEVILQKLSNFGTD